VLQFTLPGSPNLYYGSEVGMAGAGDPGSRGPMRWDLVRDDNDDLRWTRQLIALRKQHRALRVGDYRGIESQRLFAFERHTDRVLDTVIVLANPGDRPVRERVLVANAELMDGTPMVDLLAPAGTPAVAHFGPGLLTVEVPAHGVRVLAPVPAAQGGYSRYKRVN
jgi:glycosidase